ncbi:hypothetical protein AB0N31_03445 [Streptomyces sp. NPDC051051]|uniref:hypothetical protein n=1 Tax=Streptomyces sp. NPDC051051 TaxID=3155666 RepID=UPI00343D3C6D
MRSTVTTQPTPASDPPNGQGDPGSAAQPPPGDPPTCAEAGVDSMSALLVASLRRGGSRFFEARCQWPRWHALNERRLAVTHHPVIMAESTRQLAAAVRLRHLPEAAVPLRPLAVCLGLDPRTQPVERDGATDVAVRVTVSDLQLRGGSLAGYRLTAEFLHARTRFGTCTMDVGRPPRPGPAPGDPLPAGLLPPPPAAVGAAVEADVLLARAPQGRLVIVPRDPGHPVLLPGRPDVLPLLAVLEAGRQAALLYRGVTAAAVVGLAVRLHGPVPSRGAVVDVAAERGAAQFVVASGGQCAATGTVTLLTTGARG